jgi:hypothetical protein
MWLAMYGYDESIRHVTGKGKTSMQISRMLDLRQRSAPVACDDLNSMIGSDLTSTRRQSYPQSFISVTLHGSIYRHPYKSRTLLA